MGCPNHPITPPPRQMPVDYFLMQNIHSSRWQILHPARVSPGLWVIGFSIGMAPRWGDGGGRATIAGSGRATFFNTKMTKKQIVGG
ncbi:MAG: hypothetical protein ACOC3T_05100 [Bacteroidota bacterium]